MFLMLQFKNLLGSLLVICATQHRFFYIVFKQGGINNHIFIKPLSSANSETFMRITVSSDCYHQPKEIHAGFELPGC